MISAIGFKPVMAAPMAAPKIACSEIGQSRADPAKYRPEGELDKWKERDPIKLYRERLRQFGIAEEAIAAIENDVRRRVDEATEKCKAAPPPPLELLTTDVYADGGFAWRN